MAIFKSRKEKFEARVKQIEQMSDDEYNEYKQTNFAHKKKVATGWLIGSVVVTALLLSLLAITGVAWGWAVYKIAFALTTTVVGGSASAIVSAFFRRHYKRELKVQKLVKERDNAKTIKGRNIDTQKQTQLDNQIAKGVNKLQKAGKITAREAKEYRGGNEAVVSKARARSADKQKAVQEVFQKEIAGIKAKRDAVIFSVQNEWEYYKNNERENYKNDNACKGKIEVLCVNYDKDGQPVYDNSGELQYKTNFSVNSNSDIDLSKSNAIVYDNLAKQDIDFPVKVRTTIGDKVNIETYNNKTSLIDARDSALASTQKYLAEHKNTNISQQNHDEIDEPTAFELKNFDDQVPTISQ